MLGIKFENRFDFFFRNFKNKQIANTCLFHRFPSPKRKNDSMFCSLVSISKPTKCDRTIYVCWFSHWNLMTQISLCMYTFFLCFTFFSYRKLFSANNPDECNLSEDDLIEVLPMQCNVSSLDFLSFDSDERISVGVE